MLWNLPYDARLANNYRADQTGVVGMFFKQRKTTQKVAADIGVTVKELDALAAAPTIEQKAALGAKLMLGVVQQHVARTASLRAEAEKRAYARLLKMSPEELGLR